MPPVVVRAREPLPRAWDVSVFLAGPSPRDAETPSWRGEAAALLAEEGFNGVVFDPEAEDYGNYEDQTEWEKRALDAADVILFWVPREMTRMPGLTTNTEFGRYVGSGKVVLGAPEWAKQVRYLAWMHNDVNGQGMNGTLRNTVREALAFLERVGGPVPRQGGERFVPLHIWNLPSFQSWYKSQVRAGNRLDDAKLLWHFKMPKARVVFSWVLWVKVWIGAEQRWKENEWVFARTDISSVILYMIPDTDAHWEDGLLRVQDTEIVLVREFRSPARTKDGFIREVPGGSSLKPDQDSLKVASEEVHEETGLTIAPQRFTIVGSRQLAGTLSSHHASVYAAELTGTEMAQAKELAASNQAHGVELDSERTYVEVMTFGELLRGGQVDWATLGMIAQRLLTMP